MDNTRREIELMFHRGELLPWELVETQNEEEGAKITFSLARFRDRNLAEACKALVVKRQPAFYIHLIKALPIEIDGKKQW